MDPEAPPGVIGRFGQIGSLVGNLTIWQIGQRVPPGIWLGQIGSGLPQGGWMGQIGQWSSTTGWIGQIVPEQSSKFEQFGLEAPPGAGFIDNGLEEHCSGQHLLT